MIKTIGRLLLAAVIIFAVIRVSTFGWQPSAEPKIVFSVAEQETAQRLQKMVEVLSEEIGTRSYVEYENLEKAAKYIEDSFRGLGYETQIQAYEIEGQTFKNIIAYQKEANAQDWIILGAHYDSCFNPGADDNASGVAGLLELARLLKDSPSAHSLRFVAFTNEEPPFFLTEEMGSRRFTQWLKENHIQVKAAIILEMMGYYSNEFNSQRYLPLVGPFYPNQGNFLAVVGNFPSRRVVSQIVHGFRKFSRFPIRSLVAPSSLAGVYFSDHWSFWQEKIPAVMITDTAYLRNPNYHQDSDRASTLNYKKMSRFVHGLKEAIIYFVQQDNLILNDIHSRLNRVELERLL